MKVNLNANPFDLHDIFGKPSSRDVVGLSYTIPLPLSAAAFRPAELKRLGLYILAPAETIAYSWFERPLNKADIRQKVEKRVQAYEGEKDRWIEVWFLPVLDPYQ